MSPGTSPPVEIPLVNAACPMGCPDQERLVVETPDQLPGSTACYRVVACSRCGLMRTNPRPAPEAMGLYYRSDYRPYQLTRQRRPRGAELTSRILLAQATPALPPGRMLEIGCASGSYLDLMARRGWQVAGVEYGKDAAAFSRARGFTVHAGPLETAPEPEEPFDLVTGWMVVEHLLEPVACLRKLASWTRPGGWLAISVPNAGSPAFRLFRESYYPLQMPYHLYHFTERTLGALLRETGWQVRMVRYERNLSDEIGSLGIVLQRHTFWRRLGAALTSYPCWGGRLNLALLPLSYPLALLKQTSRMVIWARKPLSAAG